VLVRGFPAQAFDTNCYVVAPGPGEQCVVVDPGIGVEAQLDEVLREQRLQPVAVLLTHGHVDHVGGVTSVVKAQDHPVPVHIHREDEHMLLDPVGSRSHTGARFQLTPIVRASRAVRRAARRSASGSSSHATAESGGSPVAPPNCCPAPGSCAPSMRSATRRWARRTSNRAAWVCPWRATMRRPLRWLQAWFVTSATSLSWSADSSWASI